MLYPASLPPTPHEPKPTLHPNSTIVIANPTLAQATATTAPEGVEIQQPANTTVTATSLLERLLTTHQGTGPSTESKNIPKNNNADEKGP